MNKSMVYKILALPLLVILLPFYFLGSFWLKIINELREYIIKLNLNNPYE